MQAIASYCDSFTYPLWRNKILPVSKGVWGSISPAYDIWGCQFTKLFKKLCFPLWSTSWILWTVVVLQGIEWKGSVSLPDSDTQVQVSCACRTKDLLAGRSSLALIFSTSSASSYPACYLLSKMEAVARSPLYLFVVSLCGKLFVRNIFCLNMWRNMFCQVYFSYVKN